ARLLRFDPESGATEQVRNQIGRINGVAAGPGGELYGCQESSRRIIEFMPDGSARITATRLDGRLHNFPSDLAIDRDGRIWFADPFSATLATGPQLYPQLDHAS